MQIGTVEIRAGFVTRQFNLQGRTLSDIEKRLGYQSGRLSQGAYFLVALELPLNDGFELAGYSQVAGHHTNNQYPGINDPGDPTLPYKKRLASSQWALWGQDRLVKVIPVQGQNAGLSDDENYPPGSGIQQWKLIKPIKFTVESFVAGYPGGTFTPKQGYTPVKYV